MIPRVWVLAGVLLGCRGPTVAPRQVDDIEVDPAWQGRVELGILPGSWTFPLDDGRWMLALEYAIANQGTEVLGLGGLQMVPTWQTGVELVGTAHPADSEVPPAEALGFRQLSLQPAHGPADRTERVLAVLRESEGEQRVVATAWLVPEVVVTEGLSWEVSPVAALGRHQRHQRERPQWLVRIEALVVNRTEAPVALDPYSVFGTADGELLTLHYTSELRRPQRVAPGQELPIALTLAGDAQSPAPTVVDVVLGRDGRARVRTTIPRGPVEESVESTSDR